MGTWRADAAGSALANPATVADAEKGIVEISKTFREQGEEIYLPTN
jgi:hypothetical protein